MGRLFVEAATPGHNCRLRERRATPSRGVGHRHDGEPVQRLSESSFALDSVGVAPGGSAVVLDDADEVKPAVYLGRVIPLGAWEDGRYLLALTFRTGVSAARRSSPPLIR